MDKDKRNLVYDEALETFGMQCQYDQCVEEMAELMVAINKIKRQENFGEYEGESQLRENLFEELADVFICVEGLAHFLGEDKFDDFVNKKMEKFEKTVNKFKK